MDITKNKTVIQVLNTIKIGDDIKDAVKYLDSIKMGHGIDTEKSAMYSMVKGVSHDMFVSESIQIVFYFNSNNKIVKIDTKSVYTGP